MYKPNFTELDKLTEEGYLRKVISPCGKLMLYNYTDKTTYERTWNEHTLNSRGSVYEIETGEIVARAFPKFFNLGELDEDKQRNIMNQTDFLTYEKMDGSLGIVYYYDCEWRINTRGSFTSDQAVKATTMLDNYDFDGIGKDCTFLVEIIYPDNRIIVDYGGEEKLTLLAVYDAEGEMNDEFTLEVMGQSINMGTPKAYKFDNMDQLITLQSKLPAQEEGFVVQFSNGERVKFKSIEYLKIARILSGCSPLTFWEGMVDGKVDVTVLEQIPEEFREEYEIIAQKLEDKYEQLHSDTEVSLMNCCNNINHSLEDIPTNDTRKNLGLYLKNNDVPHKDAMFTLLLYGNADKYVMKHIRPTANRMGD